MSDHESTHEPRLTRRSSLLRLGGLVAGLAGGGAALHGLDEADAAGAGPAGVAAGPVTCVLTPEQTEGPYYVDDPLVRRDVREGKPGVLLNLRTTVVDASTCRPIRGAAVDIWHADASGVYSGVGGASGSDFLRGIQRTDAKGLAVFRTIYPGWYPGRAVHIHVKVHLGGNVVHTGQLYFPEAVTDAVYERAPYSRRPGRDTPNASDAIYRNGGRRSLLAVKREGGAYTARIMIGVNR